MQTNTELGGYALGEIVRLYGSFKTNGSSAPDTFRDGHSTLISSVTRVSQGLYEVTLSDGYPIPELPIIARAHKSGSATPARACTVEVVDGTWSRANRKFRIVCVVVGDTANSAYVDPVVQDPDTGDRIGFEIVGSIASPGTDLA